VPCNGCKEERVSPPLTRSDARRRLDSRLMAGISKAIREVQATNPELARELLSLNGELNALGVEERKLAGARP
jgi:hypothetical protein